MRGIRTVSHTKAARRLAEKTCGLLGFSVPASSLIDSEASEWIGIKNRLYSGTGRLNLCFENRTSPQKLWDGFKRQTILVKRKQLQLDFTSAEEQNQLFSLWTASSQDSALISVKPLA